MIDRRRFLSSASAGVAAVSAGPALARVSAPNAGNGAGDPALAAFMDKYFESQVDASPETATQLGLDKGARAALKSRLTIPTREQEEKDRARVRAARAELGGLNRAAMNAQDAIHYDTIAANLDAVIKTFSIPYGQGGWPQVYRVSQGGGAYLNTGDFLDNQHTIATQADAEAYVSRVNDFADVLAAETDRVLEDFALGVIPPDFILKKTIGLQAGMLGTAAGESTLVQSIVRRTREKSIPGDWGARVEKLVSSRVYPALQRQNDALKAALPKAGHEASVARLPQGAQYYANSLNYITTTRMTAEEIHRVGLEQVADLTARSDALLKSQGYSQGTVGERMAALVANPANVYPNTDEAKVELIAHLNEQMAAMQALLPKAFGRLPKSSVEIKRVPPEIQEGASQGYYNSPSLDGSRPGIYWINLTDTANWPKFGLPTLTYHEAIPGHHLQIALQQESAAAPKLMNLIFFSSYGEGWGLYAEQLADELGAYDNDPLGRVGFYQSLLFRAVRLVVDTGIHFKGWSREQAIRYFIENTGRAEGGATSEVERYCSWPGQACAYKVGHNEWVRLREKARKTLGPRFDLRGFHDMALAGGGMPLTVLERVVDNWILAHKASAA
ncbi:MAG: DUF885 domain-containing protein [Novosphingobium pentaromativorans]|uniref:DUF885 domain-containing protein n=1 Tax=Novosphingobium pentaromativorans TaxID=205844 RepID=A0A2W5P036_9SPHN|nr:DUF885 family protein [Novosphingobium panipatense]PZQ57499.1 MAG: DUF885 domain-containing protein [Novosphingobium pentaromativorans]